MDQRRFEERDQVLVFAWVDGIRLVGMAGIVVAVTETLAEPCYGVLLCRLVSGLSPVQVVGGEDLVCCGRLPDPLLDAEGEEQQ